MFPLRDDNPTLSGSVATFAIIGLNAAAWVFVQVLEALEVLTDLVVTTQRPPQRET